MTSHTREGKGLTADCPVRRYRSDEEGRMRAIIVPELRKRWPDARIIHELPLRYSTNRIDLAAVTPGEIVSVEIKSSRDVADRLERQLRGFIPISARVIVALAPKWNESLPSTTKEGTLNGRSYTSYISQYTPAQQAVRNSDDGHSAIEIWTVDADAGTIEITDGEWRKNTRPWPARMLHILHVSELLEIARRHRCWSGKNPRHDDLVAACTELMTGREVAAAVCAALRARSAFAAESDPPRLALSQSLDAGEEG